VTSMHLTRSKIGQAGGAKGKGKARPMSLKTEKLEDKGSWKKNVQFEKSIASEGEVTLIISSNSMASVRGKAGSGVPVTKGAKSAEPREQYIPLFVDNSCNETPIKPKKDQRVKGGRAPKSKAIISDSDSSIEALEISSAKRKAETSLSDVEGRYILLSY
jgi:hypothetical protein